MRIVLTSTTFGKKQACHMLPKVATKHTWLQQQNCVHVLAGLFKFSQLLVILRSSKAAYVHTNCGEAVQRRLTCIITKELWYTAE